MEVWYGVVRSTCSFLLRSALKEYGVVLVKLVALDAILWLLTWSSSVYVEPVSRRFANLTYILWTVSLVHTLCDYYYHSHNMVSR